MAEPQSRPRNTSPKALVSALALALPLALGACGNGDTPETGPLSIYPDDIIKGDPNAPVTVIEYASMTCGFCARFHNEIYPEIEERYVDTGKVKFVFRPFPLDPVAARASMLIKCVGPERSEAMIDLLFTSQNTWARQGNPDANLITLASQAALSQADVEACYGDEEHLAWLDRSYQEGAETLNVDSTPTFFINGERVSGVPRIDEFSALIEEALPAG